MGSRQLSKDGAIISRLAAIEDMAGMNMLCSDKTGTLTLNKMVIQEETPVYMKVCMYVRMYVRMHEDALPTSYTASLTHTLTHLTFPHHITKPTPTTQGETQYSILRYGAMAAKWKEPPRDALDTLVLGCVDMASLENVTQTDYMPFDPTVKRTEGTIRLPSGGTFKTTKGAPHILLKLIDDHAIIEVRSLVYMHLLCHHQQLHINQFPHTTDWHSLTHSLTPLVTS